jgi:hypothetical protein
MASSQTTFGGVEQPATGENLNVWGPLVNKMAQRSIEMGAGFKTISLTGNYTPTTTIYDANESRWGCIEFTDGGLSSQPTVTLPAETRYWLIINSGSTYAVACKASGSAEDAVTVEASSWAWIYCDGTDMFVRDLSTLSGDLALSSIADIASSRVIGNMSGSTAAPSLITVYDEDAMSSNSATGLATQQSIKAYVDTSIASGDVAIVAANIADIQDAAALVDTLTPDTSTDNALARWSGTAGATLENSGWTLSDADLLTAGGELNAADNLLTRALLKDYGEEVNAIGSIGGGTQDIDLTLGNVVTGTVDTSTTTFTFSNPTASGDACSFTLILTNGGSQTINWPASVDWAAATAPTLTAAGVDVLAFVTTDGGTTWLGFAAGLDLS